MIYTNRASISEPKILKSHRVTEEFERMEFHYQQQDEKSKYRRYKFNIRFYASAEVKSALKQLFDNKCVYCESVIGIIASGDVDQFRPKGGSMNTDGSFDPQHYWWLAYEWENLYMSCQVCNQRYKKNNFPVRGERTSIKGDVSLEDPLLIDPCNREDFMVEHIGYERELAVPLTEKGEHTIKILGLNREELLSIRKESLERLEAALFAYNNSNNNSELKANSEELIKKMIDRGSSYLACKWANYWKQLLDVTQGQFPEYLPYFDSWSMQIESNDETPFVSNVQKSPPKKKSRKSYSLDKMNTDARNIYFGESRWITRVRIKNFKIIEDLELKFVNEEANTPNEFHEPWMALLGENGTGKSTVLQAITLTLSGEERLNKLGLDARKFVNRNTEEDSGWVKVYLSDRKTPITLTFSKSSEDFGIAPKAPQLIVRSYGSTRLFSKDSENNQDKDFLFIENLFDPLALLLNGNKWLSEKIKDEELFPEIAKSLADLLALNDDQYFYPDKDEDDNDIVCLKLYPNKQGVPLDDLSAGYKAILALGLDIMMGFGQIWPSIFNAQGIVLVDEIGVHLHPRWKMRIVSALRDTFPSINFVMATHEPLCLRGLEKGEVILMRLDEQKNIEIINDLPSPKTMRVGQLLTSVFGLHTTMDPDLEKQYSEFYQLQSLRTRTEEEEERFEELKVQLKDDLKEDPVTGRQRLNVLLGDDVSEMLGFGIIEQKIADYKAGKSKPSLKDLKEDTLKEVQALWKS